MSDRVFVAEQAPAGWRFGKWKQTGKEGLGVWEERKLDEPGVAYIFDVVEQPTETAGSTTVRLRMRDANTEVLLLDRTAQIFVDGHYFGEYRGHWEVGGKAVPTPPGSISQPAGGSRPAPQQAPPAAAGGGYVAAPAPAPPPVAFAANKDTSPELVDGLYKAVEAGQLDGVKRLLGSGVDPNVVKKGKSVLLIATGMKGSIAIIHELLNAGADPHVPGPSGELPVTVAFQKGYQDVTSALFRASFMVLQRVMDPTDLGAISGSIDDYESDGISAYALQELHDTTAKLVALKVNPYKAPKKKHHEDEDMDAPMGPGGVDVGGLRENAVREAMRSLCRSSHLAEEALKDCVQDAEPQ